MEFLKKLSRENNVDILFECVTYLEGRKDYKTLETVFKKYLVGSCDIRVWRIYLNYVTNVKRHKDKEVYEFVIKNIGYHWQSTDIYKEYITFLLNGEDTTDKVDNIRGLYMRMLHIPIVNLLEVYNSYEEFENEFNKLNARRILGEAVQVYQNSYKVYNNTIGFITNPTIENSACLIDLERKNPLNLDERNFIERLDFIYRYFVSLFYKNEEPVYFYVDHLIGMSNYEKARDVLEKALTTTTSIFLKIFYGRTLGDQGLNIAGESDDNPGKIYFLNLLGEQYDDVVAVNLLNFVLKNEGLEAFRRMFIKFKLKFPIGPTVFEYVAKTEFYTGNNKKIAYDIFTIGLEAFPNSNLSESFFYFLLSVGDEDNAKALFKKSNKTVKMWDKMAEYEYLYGGDVQYKELLNERIGFNKTKQYENKDEEFTGILLKYKLIRKNLSFGLSMDHPKKIYDFIFSLPPVNFSEDFLCAIDLDKVQEFMKEIKL